MDVGYPNAAVRDYQVCENLYEQGMDVPSGAVTTWAPLRATDAAPTFRTIGSPYSSPLAVDDGPIVKYVYTNNTTWGFQFLESGYYIGDWTLQTIAASVTGGSQSMGYHLGLNAAKDTRSITWVARYDALNDQRNVILPVVGVFYAGDYIQPGHTIAITATNAYQMLRSKLCLRKVRDLVPGE